MATAKKLAAQVRILRDEAHQHFQDFAYEKAALLYQKLHRLDNEEPEWPRRAADCYLHLNDPKKRLALTLVAAKLYSENGYLLKGIAMCKIVLSIDPEHSDTQNDLAALHARRPGIQKRHAQSPKRRSPRPPALLNASPPLQHNRAQRARARMMAAHALRDIRQRRTETRDAHQQDVHVRENLTHESTLLRTSLPPVLTSRPPLQSFIPTVSRPSLPPQSSATPAVADFPQGNIYSLTLDDIPSRELRSAPLPVFSSNQELTLPLPSSAPLPLLEDSTSFARQAFANTPLLSDLSRPLLHRLISEVDLIELQPQQILFSEGDKADAMFVIVEGSVSATTLDHQGKSIVLAHLEEGDFFGEIGLLSDQPRQASVLATTETRLLQFSRDAIGELIESDSDFLRVLLNFLRDRLIDDLMLTSALFAPFNEQERIDLAARFEFLEIESNSVLLDEGQQPIGMYVLLTGEALSAPTKGAGALRRLGPGDIFGEQALLENRKAKSQVRTMSKCFAICLPSDSFNEVIMTHPTVLEYLSNLHKGTELSKHHPNELASHVTFF